MNVILAALFILSFSVFAQTEDPCGYFRARAKLVADPLSQPQLFGSYEQNPDRLKVDDWSSETRAGVSFDFARFSQGMGIRGFAEKECAFWQKKEHTVQQTTSAFESLKALALGKKRQVLTEALHENEAELNRLRAHGTLEQQNKLEGRTLILNSQIAAIESELALIPSAPSSARLKAAPELEQEISELAEVSRELEVERAKVHRLDRPNVVLSGGTIQRDTPGARGDALPYFFSLELKLPISEFFVGSRAEGMTTNKSGILEDSIVENLKTWMVNYRAQRKLISQYVALYQQRLDGINQKLKIIKNNGGSQFAELSRTLAFEAWDVKAELAYNETMLGAQSNEAPRAAANSPAKEQKLQYAKLFVTEGEMSENGHERGVYLTKDERLRAKALEPVATRLEMSMTYQGRSTETKLLKSGAARAQMGCYLAAKNQCNLVYAMWRIEPESGIFVQTKTNPGQSTHEECENNGYATVKPVFQKKIAAPQINRSYKYVCELSKGILTVSIDDQKVWSGKVETSKLNLNGYTGVRSDNVKWQFAVSKEPANL